jgi:hypothetical protein
METSRYGIMIYEGGNDDNKTIFDNCIVKRSIKNKYSKKLKSINSRWLVNIFGIRLMKSYVKY